MASSEASIRTFAISSLPLIELASDHDLCCTQIRRLRFEIEHLPENVQLRMLPWHGPLSTIQHDFLLRRQMEHDRSGRCALPCELRSRASRRPDRRHRPRRDQSPPAVGDHPRASEDDRHDRQDDLSPLLDSSLSHRARRSCLPCHGTRRATSPSTARSRLRRSCRSRMLRRLICCRRSDQATLDEVRRALHARPPFVLADALKNPATLVARLAVGCRRSSKRTVRSFSFHVARTCQRQSVDAVVSGEARLLLRPSRRDLIALYRLADAFVFPSWIEGLACHSSRR